MQVTMLLGLIRHLLTLVGGIMVSKGWLSSDTLDIIIGAILAVAPTIWSTTEKIQVQAAGRAAVVDAAKTRDPNTSPVPDASLRP